MKMIHFTKAEGAQNDFVIVDDRESALSDGQRQRFTVQTAHRRKGVGSDGAIFIDASDHHDFAMAFYNPDGSVGSMCGNGGRCAALYAYQNGIAGADMQFEVLGRSYRAAVHGALVQLSFPRPEELRLGIALRCGDENCEVDFVDNGAPHIVVFAEQLPSSLRAPLQEVDMRRVGALLRWHERFAPRGANVNVLELDASGTVHIRTFEKGVEDETAACGTGTLASGMIAHLRSRLAAPIAMRTYGGDRLLVHFTPSGGDQGDPAYYEENLMLEGPARLVFDGCIPLLDD